MAAPARSPAPTLAALAAIALPGAMPSLMSYLDEVQRDIDHFLAMELLYKNQDEYNAGNFGAYQVSVVY